MTPSDFPNDAIFHQMAQLSVHIQHPIIIDPSAHVEATYNQLFHDVALLREDIVRSLPADTIDANGIIRSDCDNFICVLCPGDYEFIVAFVAILSVGGAVTPLGDTMEPDNAAAFFDKVNSSLLIVSSYYATRAIAIQAKMQATGRNLSVVSLNQEKEENHPVACAKPGEPAFRINEAIQISPERPAAAIFTSGTTGRPKAALIPRRRIFPLWPVETAIKMAQESIMVSYRPPQWIGGVRGLTRCVLEGVATLLTPPRADAAVLWSYIRDYAPTDMDFVPFTLKKMQAYYEAHISTLAPEEVAKYAANVSKMTFICYGAMIEQRTRDFWTGLAGKNIIRNMYAATESSIVAISSVDADVKSIGSLFPGVEMELSEGDYGEARVKSPHMFLGYLNSPEANKEAFDEEGWFKTGDVLRKVGNEYYFEGRVESDFIGYHAYKVSILEVETALANLPYIAEAHIVSIPDYDAKELIGAIVRIKDPAINHNDAAASDRYLDRIRTDLSHILAPYKLPVLVRYLTEDEQVPRTHSSKVIKRGLVQTFLGIDGLITPDYVWPRTEYLPSKGVDAAGELQPWDWSGKVRGSE